MSSDAAVKLESASQIPKNKTRTHLISGFTGGLTSAVILQPFDLLKTRIQQSPEATLVSCLKLLKHPTELWRGTAPSAIRTSVGSALYLSFLNYTRVYLSKLNSGGVSTYNESSRLVKLSLQQNLMTGMFSRAVIGWVTMPFTIIKVRYESSLYHYNSMGEAVRLILKNEGISGFFKGYWATAARDAPYAGLYVLFYEQLKSTIPSLMFSSDSETTFLNSSKSAIVNTSSAMLAASTATVITSPFDTIKTNMQLNPQWSFTKTCSSLYSTGGAKRFLDGLSLRLVRKGCSAGIAWCLYEELVKYFG